MKRHMQLSIIGALKNWSESDFNSLAKDNNMTGKEMKEHFIDLLSEGTLFIPYGECNNFDPKKGCLGHEE